MSGHSKWSKIKRQKGVKDVKRGELFTKAGKNITLAAKEGGGDPDTNFSLRLAIEKARTVNMPSKNIERAIKRGVGSEAKDSLQRISYEAFGHGNVNLIIDCHTDNTNRTISAVRKIIENFGGKMGGSGSIAWNFVERGLVIIHLLKIGKTEQFNKKGIETIVNSEEAQLELMDLEGVLDINEIEGENDKPLLEILTLKKDFAKILSTIEKNGYKIESAELVKISKEKISVEKSKKEKIEKLILELENHEDVENVWSNLDSD